MSTSAQPNEHHEALFRAVSQELGSIVLHLINDNKKLTSGNILAQLIEEIEHEKNQQRFATLRSAIEVVGMAPKG